VPILLDPPGPQARIPSHGVRRFAMDHPLPRRPVATVLVLNDNEPVIEPLLASIEGWRSVLTPEQWEAYRDLATAAAHRVDREVRLTGSAAVYRGAPDVAHGIDAALRAAGLTTSVNQLVPDARQGA
jgi:uncharacterized protein YjeT (DUF2065 family)